jgi:23S rRNA (pseudouridine1915-N3)-methyltransferase
VRIRVLWFGRPKASPYEAEVDTYRRRVFRRWPAEDQAMRPVAEGRERDPRRAMAKEAETVRKQLPEGWAVVALDERGKRLDSVGFAEQMEQMEESGLPGVVFVVGSDLGLDHQLTSEARLRLALSPMTLPHLLARLVLWEQLFRATHILGGGSYHRK